MTNLRIDVHPILGPSPQRDTVSFRFDSQDLQGYRGEPIAAALLANGIRTLRRHEATNSPRGVYCAIGHCLECRVYVKNKGILRSCLIPLEADMEISSCRQLPNEIA